MSRQGAARHQGGRAGLSRNTGGAPAPASPRPAGAGVDDEAYLTPRVRRMRHVVWAMLVAWLVLAVLAVVLVRLL